MLYICISVTPNLRHAMEVHILQCTILIINPYYKILPCLMIAITSYSMPAYLCTLVEQFTVLTIDGL